MSKATQADMILDHLRKLKRIEPLEALSLYGVYRLGARIHDLRKLGHMIITKIKKGDRGKHWAIYHYKGFQLDLFKQEEE